jgi:hypothetical protein
VTPYQDYPRMMFHRSGLTCVVLSRDEEDGLGVDWRRTVWPAEPMPIITSWPPALDESAFTPEPPAAAVPEPEDDGDPWDAPDEASAFDPAPKRAARKRR